MKIKGLQKLTLLDYPEKTACTVFTGGCDFLCPFCHNIDLVIGTDDNYEIAQEEFFSFLKKRKGVLDGVCITGGEPLMHSEISNFISAIKNLGYSVKIDTNGSYPERLISLVKDGLIDYVAMDIKSSKEGYPLVCGIKNYDTSAVEKSVDFLMSGEIPFEFRTTVVRELHSENDFIEIGKWIKGSEKYFLQTFKNYENVIKKDLSAYNEAQMNHFKELLIPYVPNTKIRGE